MACRGVTAALVVSPHRGFVLRKKIVSSERSQMRAKGWSAIAEYDLLIKNGTIVDGMRMPAFRGDVGIRAGKIVAMGNLKETAARTIDATGMVVAPER